MRDATARRLSTLHTLAYRLTGGRIGRRLVNNDMLLLTTTGRRSGRQHTIPLLYLRDDGDGVIVIASWGGRDYPPHWYLNVRADPAVFVQIDGALWEAVAHELDEPERSTWWQHAITAYDGYAEYQSRTDRVIPILRLTPVP